MRVRCGRQINSAVLEPSLYHLKAVELVLYLPLEGLHRGFGGQGGRRRIRTGVAKIRTLGRILVAGELHLVRLEGNHIRRRARRTDHRAIKTLRLQSIPQTGGIADRFNSRQVRIREVIRFLYLGVQFQNVGAIPVSRSGIRRQKEA